jgi:hypothetical protein
VKYEKSNNKDNLNNEFAKNEKHQELLKGKQSSYLNIWEKIPSYKDINTSVGIIRIIILIAVAGMLIGISYYAIENIAFSLIFPIFMLILFLIGFRENFFLTSGLGKQRYGQIPLFNKFRFWQLDEYDDTLYLTNTQDLMNTGIRLYKISVIPENIQPNLNHFIKSLHISKIPFSYQVIQTPLVQNSAETMNITILFSLSYYVKGILTNKKINKVNDALKLFSYTFESACIANLAHYKIESLSGAKLIYAFRTFLFGVPEEPKDFSDGNSFMKNRDNFSPLKIIVICGLIIYIFISIGLSPIHFCWGLIINIIFFFGVLVLFWREAIYGITQFSLLKKNNSYKIINPFKHISFYRLQSYKNILFIHSNKKILTAIHLFNVKYALPPQFLSKDRFIARIEKLFRAIVSKKLPFTYTLITSPLFYENFEKEGLKHIIPSVARELRQRKTEYEWQQWLDMRNGIWRVIDLFSVQEHIYSTHIDEFSLEKIAEKLNHRSNAFLTLFKANISNYELEALNARKIFPAIYTTFLKTKFFRMNGSHLNYLLLQGKTLINLIELSSVFKKGIETRLAAEFNTPLNLSNFITIGQTLNTEFLKEEVPAGFTLDQVKNLLIVNGNFHSREELLQKIVVELVKNETPSIIFDYYGTFSKFLPYFTGSRFEGKFLFFSLGKNFQLDPFDSDIPYDKERDAYIDYIVDILAMVYKQRKLIMENLREILKEENFSYAEFLLDVKNKNVWEKNSGMDPIASMLKQIKEVPSVIANKIQEESGSERTVEDQVYAYQFVQNDKNIIIDLSIFRDLEPKVFMAFVIIAKIIFYMAQFQEEVESMHKKIMVIPNGDIIFDNFYLDTQINYRYGKVMKLLKPLQMLDLGVIMTCNQIRYLHPNVFNYFGNIISFKATDKRDIDVLKNQMSLQELHGIGYYTSTRKDSYQIQFLMNLKENEILVKRADIHQPFPVIMELEELKDLKPMSQEEINQYMSQQGYNLHDTESRILSNAQKTLFEQHFKNYIIFLDEIIKFFSILQTLDNVGNLYKSKIKEELLKIMYPKVQKKFGKDKRQIKLIRDKLFNIFLKHGYIVENHPRRASGSQSIRPSYSVGPQYQESLEDYFEMEQERPTNISVETLEQESSKTTDFKKIFGIDSNKREENDFDSKKHVQYDIKEIILDHSSKLLMNLIDISIYIDEKKYEKAVLLERRALPEFLINVYCSVYPREKNEMPDLLIDKAATFLLKNVRLSITRKYLDAVLERCQLKEIRIENIKEYISEIRDLSDVLFEFFTILHTDIRKLVMINKKNNKNYEMIW